MEAAFACSCDASRAQLVDRAGRRPLDVAAGERTEAERQDGSADREFSPRSCSLTSYIKEETSSGFRRPLTWCIMPFHWVSEDEKSMKNLQTLG